MIWQDFQRPAQVDYEEEGQGPTFGRFLAQPFERGWGTTLGNSLRRALLSSIPSAAITAVKIEGESLRPKTWVRLTRDPQGYRTMLGVFDSVDDATNAISEIIGAGIVPAALAPIANTPIGVSLMIIQLTRINAAVMTFI